MLNLIILDVPYIIDTFHILRSVFNTQFIQYTKYTKYAFLLLLSIFFLDVTFTKSDNFDFITVVYVKSPNIHKFVEYYSCHHKAFKNGIPFSQHKWYKRILPDDAKFSESD